MPRRFIVMASGARMNEACSSPAWKASVMAAKLVKRLDWKMVPRSE